MHFSKATVKDADAIAKIHVDSWRIAYVDIFDPQWLAEMSIANRAERWVHNLNSDESETHLVRIDEKIVGFVSLGKCRDVGSVSTCGEIWAMYIAPENWRVGIGKQLMAYAIDCLQIQGFDSVLLRVLCDNARGIDFYESCGFSRKIGSEELIETGGRKVKEIAYERKCNF
jgi:ribosomal protein S18 acetylase RimI-like enzyme